MGLACPLVVLLLQCRIILYLHPVNVLSLWCFLGKVDNSNVAGRFFARTPSKILRMVNICEVMEAILDFPKEVVDFGFYAVSS